MVNRTAAVRDYIAANPGSTIAEVAAGTGGVLGEVGKTVRKMRRLGMARNDGDQRHARYFMVRDPVAKFTPEQLRASQRERARRYAPKRNAKRRKAAKADAEQTALKRLARKVVRDMRKGRGPVLTPEERDARIKAHNARRGKIMNAKTAAKRAAAKDAKAALRGLIKDCAKSTPVQRFVPGQSVDEYLANGGRVERIESHWANPIGRRVPAMPNRIRVAA